MATPIWLHFRNYHKLPSKNATLAMGRYHVLKLLQDHLIKTLSLLSPRGTKIHEAKP